MVKSGEEIQASLRKFVKRWSGYAGSEISEAQTFLNELFACYGTERKSAGVEFEFFKAHAGFMDLHWQSQLIVEMKRPNTPLEKARDQARRYWEESADDKLDLEAARWVVLCNFGEFEIWEPGRFPKKARAQFTLQELPEHSDALNFLITESVEPVFVPRNKALTTKAVACVAQLYQSLEDRLAAPFPVLQQFIMQAVWCLFAEDLGMLPDYPFHATIRRLLENPQESSAKEIGFLFRILNQVSKHNRKGAFAEIPYVNGELFANPAEVELNQDELRLLDSAAEFDWRKVDPTIFGSLLEGILGNERRRKLGAHYTHETDILKIVTPTIIRPWRERIDRAATRAQALALLHELCAFTVLDPACGCGNFLYVAYRELRALEHELKARIAELSKSAGLTPLAEPLPYFPLRNMLGIDVERTAVMITRVTLWMGQRQMVDRYGEAELPLPLVSLAGVRQADALQIDWPQADCIIGNPPFLGSQRLRKERSDEYLAWLNQHFGVGVQEFCVYWFRKTAKTLRPGQRAGLVGTNSIGQNRARAASLEYVVEQGGVITDTVSSQKWPGDAKVHVALVNWVQQPAIAPDRFILDGRQVTGIGADLKEPFSGGWKPVALKANTSACFQGPIPVGDGFIISDHEAQNLLDAADANYRDVVRPYLTGQDIARELHQGPSRWIIDFAAMPLEQAMDYNKALDIVRERVKPERMHNRDIGFRTQWWQFGRPRGELRAVLDGLPRYIAGTATGKRLLWSWQEPWTCPSNLTNVVAADDDFVMGLLTSHAHTAWAWRQSSTLKADLRYTPTSAFLTFPWPEPSAALREKVAQAAREVIAQRSAACLAKQIGLTTLYNRMDDGAYDDLRKAHRVLDEAVAQSYGWPKSVAQDDRELVNQLTALNRKLASGASTQEKAQA